MLRQVDSCRQAMLREPALTLLVTVLSFSARLLAPGCV